MSQRKQVNLQIIDALRDYICKHPEQRFGQALRNIGIVDTVHHDPNDFQHRPYFTNIFNEEPEITLAKIMKRLEEENGQTYKSGNEGSLGNVRQEE